jgi:hypothetical protein
MAQEQVTEQVRIEVELVDVDRHALADLGEQVLAHPGIRTELTGSPRVVKVEVLDKEPADHARFEAFVDDPETGRAVRVTGRFGSPHDATVESTARRPLPTRAEFDRAVAAVLGDARVAATVDGAEVTPYRPMPPHADRQLPDGTVERIVTVGLRTKAGTIRHRIVGVRERDGTVLTELDGVPAPSEHDCEPAEPDDSCDFAAGGPAQIRLRVIKGSTTLWDLVVVRPRDSSGTNGSGVELRSVDFRGRRVLGRAHTPILNVQYGDEGVGLGCGPTYRDWLNQEACFTAEGTEPSGAGFRLCSAPPQTILESGTDAGNFRGVAIWYSDGELRLVSELSAGWYRYVSDWRLHDDGRIQPRFGFAATANPCTCAAHTHHAYWRLDFDILGEGNDVVDEHNDPTAVDPATAHRVVREVRRPRDPARHRYWRIHEATTDVGYDLIPGPNDGTSDGYGGGDVWILNYHGTELDDGQGSDVDPALTRAHLHRFVTGESVQRKNIVMWYAGHFLHDESHPTGQPHIAGPELRPRHF